MASATRIRSLRASAAEAGWRLTTVLLTTATVALGAKSAPAGAADLGTTDARIRVEVYAANEVYRLKGYVGYQIDLEFEAGESFLGLGAGDLESLTFASQNNHLFIKPRSGGVETNITVLTNRRTYHFDYTASERRPDATLGDVIYVLRFTYAPQPGNRFADAVERRLANAAGTRRHNLNYSYRGSPELKPSSAWDDGVQMRLRFASQQDLPAIFARNDDGSESLLNFSIDAGEVVVQRIARQLIVRRGRLRGCILNQGFTGGGERLESGTVAPSVERVKRDGPP
jgi:type IV secretion system protein VirB9